MGLPANAKLPIPVLIECMVEGGTTRLRPVLLTAITTILGLIPLARATFDVPFAEENLAGMLALLDRLGVQTAAGEDRKTQKSGQNGSNTCYSHHHEICLRITKRQPSSFSSAGEPRHFSAMGYVDSGRKSPPQGPCPQSVHG